MIWCAPVRTRGWIGCATGSVDARVEQLEQAIREAAEQEPWRDLVARLRCLRGLDTQTALALVAEIGDFGRFRSAEALMAFLGLVPCERSSGEQRRQDSISYQLARRQRGRDARGESFVLCGPAVGVE